SVPERYPDSAGLVHREPVGMAFRYADEGPALTGGGVDREDDALAVVRQVERAAVRREADAVGEFDATADLDFAALDAQPPHPPRHAALELHRTRAHRSDVDPAPGIGRQIIEADCTLDGQERPGRSVAHVTDVAARHDQSAVGVRDQPAHAAPLGDDRVHGAVGRPAVDAACDDVAEVEPVSV